MVCQVVEASAGDQDRENSDNDRSGSDQDDESCKGLI